MPNHISYAIDRHLGRTGDDTKRSDELALPGSWFEAIFRGARSVCPRCGRNPLFGRFLKPVPACLNCGQDWSLQSADDFPAYLSILVAGHLMVPLIITFTSELALPVAMLVAIILPLTALLIVAFLQPAKGTVIATQWWLGMNGFKVERPEVREHHEVLPAKAADSESALGSCKRSSSNSPASDPHASLLDGTPLDKPSGRLQARQPCRSPSAQRQALQGTS